MSKLSQFLNSWKYHRTQTIDLLKATPEDKLTFSPSDALGSLSKQFRHLANIQHCYIEAIKTQKIDFTKKIYGKEFDNKNELITALKIEDERMLETLNKLNEKEWDKIIKWGSYNPTVYEHLFWMIDHEIMHHGQLIVYWKLLQFKFPDSWKNWGLV
ncbi:MAG: DinB family protein [Candidatus Aenigmarchaeota archaeon]|nr:DinB family protein [Candidatus Aenigmarchaeota archaeon]